MVMKGSMEYKSGSLHLAYQVGLTTLSETEDRNRRTEQPIEASKVNKAYPQYSRSIPCRLTRLKG